MKNLKQRQTASSSKASSMQSSKKNHVFVKLLTGKTVTIPVQEATTIEEIKQQICEKEHIPVASQRLIYQAQQLENERTVGSYKIQNDSTLHLVLRLVAGTQNSTTTTVNNTAKQSANKPQETKRPLPPPPVFATALNLPQPQLLFNLPTAANANIKLEQPTTTFNPFLAQQFLQIQQQQRLQQQQQQKDTKPINIPQSSPSSTTISPIGVTGTSPTVKKEQTAGKELSRKKSKRTKRGQYTKRACTNCRLAHSACDEGRPCKRCITLGKEDNCRDAERKRTRKRTLGEMDYKYYPSMADLMPLLAGSPVPDSGMDQDYSSDEDDYDDEDEEFFEEPATTTSTKTSNVNDPQNTEIKKEKKPIASPQLTSNPLMLFNSSIEEHPSNGSLLDDEPQPAPTDDTTLIGGNAVVPYLQANEYTESSSTQMDLQTLLMNSGYGEASASSFPFAQLTSMTNNNEQLLQQLMIAYAKQAQELKELKELVRHLQSMIISVSPPPAPTNTSLVSRHV